MYHADIRRKRSGTPILSRKEIDAITENLIADFCPEALKTPQEIDIDLFVQDYLKMDQDFQYLSHCGVYLGMTVFNDTDKIPVYDPVAGRAEYISARARTVIIDNTLLEENQEHRYRFTMGHEGGHGYFHTEYFAYDPDQLTFEELLGVKSPSMVQCRVDTKKLSDYVEPKVWGDKEWMEWQANAFSSSLLMPRSAVVTVCEDIKSRSIDSFSLPLSMVTEVSRVFNVSGEAAQYRLEGLGYFKKGTMLLDEGYTDMFTLLENK